MHIFIEFSKSKTINHFGHTITHFNNIQVLNLSFKSVVIEFLILELDVQITVNIFSFTN